MKLATSALEVLVLCAGLCSGQLDLKSGDSCVESYSGEPGVCTPMSKCPAALKNWKVHRIRPTVCGYEGGAAVACCAGAQQKKPTKRISQLKCEEYSAPVTETVYGSALTPDARPVATTFSNCAFDKIKLVVGGDPALPGQFPTWFTKPSPIARQVAVGWPLAEGGYAFNCGGTLVSDRFVLTAGHCASSRNSDVTSVAPTHVRLGALDLRSDRTGASSPQDARIGRIVKHPDYHAPVNYNDIALLQLVRPVEFSSFVRPACLWQSDDFGGLDSAVVTGWGAVAFGRERSDVLLKATLELFSNDVCQPLLSKHINRNWKRGFSREQMCAGDLEGKRDTCQGDSGGPLQVTKDENHCIFYVMGITSFGYACAVVNGPGVYTRVSSFVPWIESVVWPNDV